MPHHEPQPAACNDSKHHQKVMAAKAQQLAAKEQPVCVHQQAASLLLMAPNNIIFELFGTMLQQPDSQAAVAYIHSHLAEYLESIWEEKTMKHALRRLRKEQAIEAKLSNTTTHNPMPLVLEADNSSVSQICNSVHSQLMWRTQTGRQSQISALLFKLAIEDGYRRNGIQSRPYKEVAGCLRDWRRQLLIKLYSFGNAPADEQRLALASTDQGNLADWVANFIDGTEKRQKPDLIRKLASALRDKTHNCIYITHELADALIAIHSGSIRCAFVVDRAAGQQQHPHYSTSDLSKLPYFAHSLEPLIKSGRLFFMRSLDCVTFVADPDSMECC